MNRARLIRILIASLLGLALAAVVAWWTVQQDQRRGGTTAGLSVPAVSIGGPFNLVDHTGRPVTNESFAGKYRLVFFGFTNCPDICPTELQVMGAALGELGADAARVQPLFVTVDPERDTPQALAEYVALYHPGILGLTGSPSQVDAVVKSYRAHYAKVQQGAGAGDYTMDHSTYTYLMGPQGEFLTVFARGTPPAEMAQAIRTHMKG
ncbi:SCO family protein [Aerophototrophica crusticola]|uniref:SCO family protein n=1 Tax=Aerophototrophica crusticola TaxID=1709002 RepID=A0A858R3R4_9PROT|nr:SCO family protein [Rhodospirillaceae bacterium B3]